MANSKEKDWGAIADEFDEMSEYVVGRAINDCISERLSNEKNLGDVVEFGCGTGYFTKSIASNARNIIATDVSEEMLRVAKSELEDYHNIAFRVASCEATDYPDSHFDAALMVNLLHVIRDPSKALEESHRILKPEGMLIAVDLTGYGMKKLEMLKLVFRYLRKMGKPPRAGKGNLSPEFIEKLAVRNGFATRESDLMGNRIKATYYIGIRN